MPKDPWGACLDSSPIGGEGSRPGQGVGEWWSDCSKKPSPPPGVLGQAGLSEMPPHRGLVPRPHEVSLLTSHWLKAVSVDEAVALS